MTHMDAVRGIYLYSIEATPPGQSPKEKIQTKCNYVFIVYVSGKKIGLENLNCMAGCTVYPSSWYVRLDYWNYI